MSAAKAIQFAGTPQSEVDHYLAMCNDVLTEARRLMRELEVCDLSSKVEREALIRAHIICTQMETAIAAVRHAKEAACA